MKTIKIYFSYISIALFLVLGSCKNEDSFPIPDPDAAVHGFARFTSGSARDFSLSNTATPLNFEIQWVSIDNKLSVDKIQLFVTFTEDYKDLDNNPRVAIHGKKALKEVSGLGNRQFGGFSISQAEVYALFQSAQFNYGTGAVAVFNNPAKPTRNTTNRFIVGDKFTVSWALTTSDGKLFDSWSDSVCLEFPGANCSLPWTVK